VRTKSAKLTLDLHTGAGELYDLDADPGETNNVFDDPAYAALRGELEGYIARRPNDIGPNREQVGMA
jgi:hypothetical protein